MARLLRQTTGVPRVFLLTLLFLAQFFLPQQAAIAQNPGGIFRGEVRDASTAVVIGAKVIVRSSEQGPGVLLQSNGDGLYTTPTLVPGLYYLTASKNGFKEVEFGPVTLQVNQIVRVDFLLPVGTSTESIQVEASGGAVAFHGERGGLPGHRQQRGLRKSR